MSNLHIINSSPDRGTSLKSCLRVVQNGDAIILIEDAVIVAKKESQTEILINNITTKLFVLEPDLKARGIRSDQVIEGIELVSYNDFVKFTVKYNSIQTWN